MFPKIQIQNTAYFLEFLWGVTVIINQKWSSHCCLLLFIMMIVIINWHRNKTSHYMSNQLLKTLFNHSPKTIYAATMLNHVFSLFALWILWFLPYLTLAMFGLLQGHRGTHIPFWSIFESFLKSNQLFIALPTYFVYIFVMIFTKL